MSSSSKQADVLFINLRSLHYSLIRPRSFLRKQTKCLVGLRTNSPFGYGPAGTGFKRKRPSPWLGTAPRGLQQDRASRHLAHRPGQTTFGPAAHGLGQQTAVTPLKILASGCEGTTSRPTCPHHNPEHWGKPFLPFCKSTATTAGPPSRGQGAWGAQEEPRRPPSPRG